MRRTKNKRENSPFTKDFSFHKELMLNLQIIRSPSLLFLITFTSHHIFLAISTFLVSSFLLYIFNFFFLLSFSFISYLSPFFHLFISFLSLLIIYFLFKFTFSPIISCLCKLGFPIFNYTGLIPNLFFIVQFWLSC